MKYIIAFFLLTNPLTYVTEINQLQKDAQAAYHKKDYLIAQIKYQSLLEKYELDDPEIFINLAHTYFKLGKMEEANAYYQKTLKQADAPLASKCWNQLGCLAYQGQEYLQALDHFQKAILEYPANRLACRNYELLKKQLKEHPEWKTKPEQNPETGPANPTKEAPDSDQGDSPTEENPSASREDQESPENQDNPEGEEENVEGDKINLNPEKLEEIKLNRDKAETILEALRNREIQYIQQLRRRKKTRKKSQANQSRW